MRISENKDLNKKWFTKRIGNINLESFEQIIFEKPFKSRYKYSLTDVWLIAVIFYQKLMYVVSININNIYQ